MSSASRRHLAGIFISQDLFDVAVIDVQGSVVERWIDAIDLAGLRRCAVRLRALAPGQVVVAWGKGQSLLVMQVLRDAGLDVVILTSDLLNAFAAQTQDALSAALVMRCVHQTAPTLLPPPADKVHEYAEIFERVKRQHGLLLEQRKRLSDVAVESPVTIRAYVEWLVEDIADCEQQMCSIVKSSEAWLDRERRARIVTDARGPAWADKCPLDVRLETLL